MSPQDTSTIYLGIDVAKDSLQMDATVLPALPSVPNTRAGHQRLFKALRKLKGKPHLILEATGGYERPLEDALHEANFVFSRTHPKRVRALAQALGTLAKTDAIDAQMLTRFGQQIKPNPTPKPDPAQRALADFSARRAQLMTLVVREKNRLHTHHHPEIIKEAQQTIAALEQQIQQWDQRIAQLSAQDPALKAKVKRLCQIQGVASISAHAVLAAMPELGTLNRHQTGSLAGLAPRNRDSGSTNGKRTIGGGRASARRALFMAALSASRCNPVLNPFYQNLINSGKPHKSAITAVMRKLLCTMNHMLKNPHFTLV